MLLLKMMTIRTMVTVMVMVILVVVVVVAIVAVIVVRCLANHFSIFEIFHSSFRYSLVVDGTSNSLHQ